MLPKKYQISTKEVDLVFKEGKHIISPNLTFKFVLTHRSIFPRISFIAPKNIAKLAVKRNLLKRRGYRALEEQLNRFPPLFGVFIFKKYQDDVSIIENEIKSILNKIN